MHVKSLQLKLSKHQTKVFKNSVAIASKLVKDNHNLF